MGPSPAAVPGVERRGTGFAEGFHRVKHSSLVPSLLFSLALHAGAFSVLLVARAPVLVGSSREGGSGWAQVSPVIWEGPAAPEAGPSPAPSPSPLPSVAEPGPDEGEAVPSPGSPGEAEARQETAAPAGASGPAAGSGGSLGSEGEVPGPLVNPRPAYPREAEGRRLEGTVAVALQIADDGRVVGTRVVASSGHALLDQEALATLSRWRFSSRPAGSPVIELVQKVVFRLEEGSR